MDMERTLKTVNRKLSWIAYLRGIFALIIAYLGLRCLSLAKIRKIISMVKYHCSREISIDEANVAWATVQKLSFFFLGRAACLELSLAFVLFALSKSLSSTWCVGVVTEPFQAHAWVEVNGQPFQEAVSFEEQNYKKLFVV